MMKMISNMTVNEWGKCYGKDGLTTNVLGLGLGLVRKNLHFMPEGAFRQKEVHRKNKINDPASPEPPDCQSGGPDYAARRWLWMDDVWLTGWEQIYGKWYCFYDTEKRKELKDSWVCDEADSAKSSGDESEQEVLNCLNETGDTVVPTRGSTVFITNGEANTAEEVGNKDEALMPFSYEYDYRCYKLVQQEYITRL